MTRLPKKCGRRSRAGRSSSIGDGISLKRILQLLMIVAALLPCVQAATAPARRTRPNVILITIDTVRADHIGCYGATDVKTPTLDGLARDGMSSRELSRKFR